MCYTCVFIDARGFSRTSLQKSCEESNQQDRFGISGSKEGAEVALGKNEDVLSQPRGLGGRNPGPCFSIRRGSIEIHGVLH
jgi:hypothetical protein